MTTSSTAPVAGSLPPAPDAKIAMGWMHTARFLTTAAQLGNQLHTLARSGVIEL